MPILTQDIMVVLPHSAVVQLLSSSPPLDEGSGVYQHPVDASPPDSHA